jgi:hypothetical protein
MKAIDKFFMVVNEKLINEHVIDVSFKSYLKFHRIVRRLLCCKHKIKMKSSRLGVTTPIACTRSLQNSNRSSLQC